MRMLWSFSRVNRLVIHDIPPKTHLVELIFFCFTFSLSFHKAEVTAREKGYDYKIAFTT